MSNAGALWSLIAILISVILRRAYPGGVLARLYDPKDGQLKSEKHSGRGGSGKNSQGRTATVHPIQEDEEQAFSKLNKNDSFGGVEQGGQEMRDRGGDPEDVNDGGDNGGGSTGGRSSLAAGASADPLLVSNGSGGINGEINKNISNKPAKKNLNGDKEEEEQDGCCVMLLDECQC